MSRRIINGTLELLNAWSGAAPSRHAHRDVNSEVTRPGRPGAISSSHRPPRPWSPVGAADASGCSDCLGHIRPTS